MMYFEVYKSEATDLVYHKVYSDGTPIEGTEQHLGNEFIEYIVEEYEEDGFHWATQHYCSWSDSPEELLDKIREDHPASDWQNHDW